MRIKLVANSAKIIDTPDFMVLIGYNLTTWSGIVYEQKNYPGFIFYRRYYW